MGLISAVYIYVVCIAVSSSFGTTWYTSISLCTFTEDEDEMVVHGHIILSTSTASSAPMMPALHGHRWSGSTSQDVYTNTDLAASEPQKKEYTCEGHKSCMYM